MTGSKMGCTSHFRGMLNRDKDSVTKDLGGPGLEGQAGLMTDAVLNAGEATGNTCNGQRLSLSKAGSHSKDSDTRRFGEGRKVPGR